MKSRQTGVWLFNSDVLSTFPHPTFPLRYSEIIVASVSVRILSGKDGKFKVGREVNKGTFAEAWTVCRELMVARWTGELVWEESS